MMTNENRLKNIRDIFAALFFEDDDAKRIVSDSGLNRALIAWSNRPLTLWHNIVENAERSNKLDSLIDNALSIYPDNPNLLSLKNKQFYQIRSEPIPDNEWSFKSSGSQNEKIIGGTDDLLPVSFLEKGFKISSSVARVIDPMGGVGTCFLIKGDLMVTNHHVLPSPELANDSIVEFNYEKNVQGSNKKIEQFQIDSNSYFRSDKESDITVVKVLNQPSKLFGFIPLSGTSINTGDRVTIIQHPGGLEKQVALHENFVVYSDENILQYLTDTLPGSSGSPVFNTNWELIGIHRRGGWIREPNSKNKLFRNEGIRINKLLSLLK